MELGPLEVQYTLVTPEPGHSPRGSFNPEEITVKNDSRVNEGVFEGVFLTYIKCFKIENRGF